MTPTLVFDFNMYLLHTCREFDASVLSIGHAVNYLQTIPPRSESFVTIGHCDASCTEKYIPIDGVKIFNAMLHSHKAGKSLVLCDSLFVIELL